MFCLSMFSLAPLQMQHARIQVGPILTTLFSFDEGLEDSNTCTTKIGQSPPPPPAKRHLNGASLANRWWPNIEYWLGSLVIFQGIRTSIAAKPLFQGDTDPCPSKPYIFVIFQGGGSGPLSPLWGKAYDGRVRLTTGARLLF